AMLDSDPPEPTRRRRVFTQAFTPRLTADLAPAITHRVDALLDRVHESGHMDLIEDLATPLPLHVIGQLLGIPPQDRPRLHAGARGYARLWGGDDTDQTTIGQAVTDITRAIDHCRELITQRRNAPRSDLISRLASPAGRAGSLSDGELAANLFMVFTAGHYTTTDFLGNSVLALAHHPHQWQQLCTDPALASSAVTELLRYEAPVQFVIRLAAQDL
ncbi:hypothetical protein DF18_37900, partial [Streptomyces rimosus]